MRILEFNGREYNIPTSWEDIKLSDQIRVSKLSKEHSGLAPQLQILAGYTGIPVEDIKKTHINKLPELMSHLSFINEPINKDPIAEFEHKGHKYYVIPSLEKGEFQDFISIETVMNNYKDNLYEGLPMLIAILCKREGESLDDYDVEERSREFLDLPFDTANRVSVFFYQLEIASRINTPIFLETLQDQTEKEAIKRLEELEILMKQSGGQGLLGRLRRWTLLRFMKSLKKTLNLS